LRHGQAVRNQLQKASFVHALAISAANRSLKLKGFAAMTAIVQTLARAFSFSEIDILKQIVLLCGAGLLVSLMALTYGLDLSPGFF
jgi:hypothetical protein